MPKDTIHPPGDKMQKVIREYSEIREEHPDVPAGKIVQRLTIKYDLSPKDSIFLEKHFGDS